MRQKKFNWQELSVELLRSTIRKLRRRAILFKCHHFNTRETKQDLIHCLDSLFFLVRKADSLYHLHHRRLQFELYYMRGHFFLNPSLTRPL